MRTTSFGALAGATALYAALSLVVYGGPVEARATFMRISVPGATGTLPAGVNDTGTVAGVYTNSEYQTRCFVWTTGGTISYCDPDGSINTFVAGINNSGTVAGSWNDANAQTHGFVYTAGGTARSFDPQGSTRTTANGIDANGDITGEYLDSGNVAHGFICSGKCKSVTSFDVPGAAGTVGMDINDSQTVAGFYWDGSNTQHAFVRTSDGTVTTIDPQNSFYPEARFINDSGVIAGDYQDQGGYYHGFVRDASGSVTSFTVNGSSTGVGGLNSNGDVCGGYVFVGSKGVETWSFIRSAGGKIKTYSYPANAAIVVCAGINATHTSVGTYRRTKRGSAGGYMRTP